MFKIVYYEPILTASNAVLQAEVLIEEVIKYHDLSGFFITDQGLLFSSKFWSSLCYCFNVKHQLSRALHSQTNGQLKDTTI